MTESKHYPNAPILEAVLALEVLPCKEFDNSIYEAIKEKLSNEFRAEHIEEMMLEFQFGSEQKNNHSQKMVGVKLSSYDGKYVIQAKENSYSISILNSYEKWEIFSKEAYRYWNIYMDIFKPHKVIRQALRYINRIDIPESKFELKEYFKIYPHLFDDDIECDMAGFFMQLQLPQKEGGVANIMQTVTQPVKAGCTSIILDIDVFDNQHYTPDSSNLIDRISTLREQKNFIFTSAITPKTAELIS